MHTLDAVSNKLSGVPHFLHVYGGICINYVNKFGLASSILNIFFTENSFHIFNIKLHSHLFNIFTEK